MLYTIYQITNELNGKIYIGKHQTTNLNDRYYGSGKFIRSAMKKYGKENFTKEILFVFDTEEEMNTKEKELITEEFVSRKDTYNAGIGGEGGPHFKGKKHGSYMKEISSSVDHRKKNK
jgi:bisphosphoglycerate-dependent phosphoglycerate mutase